MACIYKITNTINNKIYIGQTVDLNKRLKSHSICRLPYKDKNVPYFYRAINKYGFNKFRIDIIVSGDFNKALLDDLEKHYIKLYNSNNSKVGYNSTIGGDGLRGLIRTKEHGDKISKSLMGKKLSEEHKLKLSLKKKGTKTGSESINYKGPILQLDKNNILIKQWNTTSNFVAKELNISRSSITANLIGANKTCHGYIFKYKK